MTPELTHRNTHVHAYTQGCHLVSIIPRKRPLRVYLLILLQVFGKKIIYYKISKNEEIIA